MTKKCAYTVITGNYEKLVTPKVVCDGWDYIVFSDHKIRHDIWKCRKFAPRTTGTKGSREPKILYHDFLPEYDITVYVDANYLVGDLDLFLEKAYVPGHHCAFRHTIRDCVYAEAERVVAKGKDSGGVVGEWVGKLRAMQYPKHNGLFENGIMVRDKNVPRETYIIWDTLVRLYSYRDQLTFMPAVWMRPLPISVIDHDIKRDFFDLIPHRENR